MVLVNEGEMRIGEGKGGDAAGGWMKEIVDALSKGEDGLVKVQALLAANTTGVDAEDEHGMTALQHAAYKGNHKACMLLLDQGADPNGGHHEHAYSPLHFAALSGSAETVLLLLEHGADRDATNSIKRTPSQMAAFVGNHQCVTAINSFVSREEVEMWVNAPGGGERLSPELVVPMHRLVSQSSVHPVRLVVLLMGGGGAGCGLLFTHLGRVCMVLQKMSQRQIMLSQEGQAGGEGGGGVGSELLAIKFHVLHHVLNAIQEEATALQKKNSDADTATILDGVAKALWKTQRSDGCPVRVEVLLREAVRTFPWRGSTVFRQLVTSLAQENGEGDGGDGEWYPSASQLLQATLCGQSAWRTAPPPEPPSPPSDPSFSADAPFPPAPCATCQHPMATLRCSRCHMAHYCNRFCQRIHWNTHKKKCVGNPAQK